MIPLAFHLQTMNVHNAIKNLCQIRNDQLMLVMLMQSEPLVIG